MNGATASHRVQTITPRDQTPNALAVLFTVSDTGGVPYRFRIAGSDYTMLNHGNDLRFVVGNAPTLLPDHDGFELFDVAQAAPNVAARFGAAALATGAFLIGLAARALDHDFTDYARNDRVGFESVRPDGTIEFMPTLPVPPPQAGRHAFVAVDGGVIDNEPLELARRFLSRSPEQNPTNRNGRDARYAVVLIDPFLNRANWPADDRTDLLSVVAPKLFAMLIDQARFKPQELTLALDDSVFSRFAILPEPVTRSPASLALPIACGALGGFSGFLHRSFRHHDYCLGRRNAQAFLRSDFCLPETSPLFAAWKNSGANAADWYVAEPPQGAALGVSVKTVLEAVTTAAEPVPARLPATDTAVLERLFTESRTYREKANVADYATDRVAFVRDGTLSLGEPPVRGFDVSQAMQAARTLRQALARLVSERIGLPVWRLVGTTGRRLARASAAHAYGLIARISAQLDRPAPSRDHGGIER